MNLSEAGKVIVQRALNQGMEPDDMAKVVGFMLIELLKDGNSDGMQITIDNQRYNIAIKKLRG